MDPIIGPGRRGLPSGEDDGGRQNGQPQEECDQGPAPGVAHRCGLGPCGAAVAALQGVPLLHAKQTSAKVEGVWRILNKHRKNGVQSIGLGDIGIIMPDRIEEKKNYHELSNIWNHQQETFRESQHEITDQRNHSNKDQVVVVEGQSNPNDVPRMDIDIQRIQRSTSIVDLCSWSSVFVQDGRFRFHIMGQAALSVFHAPGQAFAIVVADVGKYGRHYDQKSQNDPKHDVGFQKDLV